LAGRPVSDEGYNPATLHKRYNYVEACISQYLSLLADKIYSILRIYDVQKQFHTSLIHADPYAGCFIYFQYVAHLKIATPRSISAKFDTQNSIIGHLIALIHQVQLKLNSIALYLAAEFIV
jgi:hypothetical protein